MTRLTLPVGLVSGCGMLYRTEQVTHQPETLDLYSSLPWSQPYYSSQGRKLTTPYQHFSILCQQEDLGAEWSVCVWGGVYACNPGICEPEAGAS